MSCNGCRVLRKGCSDNCMLRQCLQCFDSPQAQAHATVFVAKFFGRAGLMSFISFVPEIRRPELFQSLLYDAVGRTVNPVGGAVGLLWTGNWHVCQSAVETVLRGGALHPLPEFLRSTCVPDWDSGSESGVETDLRSKDKKRKRSDNEVDKCRPIDINLSLVDALPQKLRAVTPEESETTTLGGGSSVESEGERQLLRLFI